MQTIIEQVTPHAWEWRIALNDHVLAGGYCRTKRDAENDAAVWITEHPNAGVTQPFPKGRY